MNHPDIAAGKVENLVAGADKVGHVGPEGYPEQIGGRSHDSADEAGGEGGPAGLVLPASTPQVGDDHSPENRHGNEDEELPQPYGGDVRSPKSADQKDVDDGDKPLKERRQERSTGSDRPMTVRRMETRFLFKLFELAEDKILGPSGGGDDPVGHGLAEFIRGGACILRDREVLLQSVRASDRHGAGDPDQLPGPDIEHFGILIGIGAHRALQQAYPRLPNR